MLNVGGAGLHSTADAHQAQFFNRQLMLCDAVQHPLTPWQPRGLLLVTELAI